MTLTQELAQALSGWDFCRLSEDQIRITNKAHGGVVVGDKEYLTSIAGYLLFCLADEILNQRDAEPPTSRGSEGEVKPVAWRVRESTIGLRESWSLRTYRPSREFYPDHEIQPLYAAPPQSHPSPEAWRQAIEGALSAAGKTFSAESVERRAAEIHAASCAAGKSANSSQSEEPRP